jgi:type I restriction enzyme S subunit
VVSGYLFAFVRSAAFIDYLVARTTGANYPAVNDGEVKAVPIPVPPLAEQERIVKHLDEADELRKLRAQADRRTAALVPALFYEMFGDPDKKPHGWPTSELGKHIDLLTGYPFKSGEYVDSGDSVRLCRGANVLPQRIDWSDVRYWPMNRASEVEQYMLRKEDIVLAMDRPWISDGLKVARLANPDLPCFLVQRVARIRPKPALVADFIYRSLCHPSFAAHCNLVKTETTVPHISPHNIRSFTVPVPPLALQKEFAQRVAEIRELEAGQAASRHRLEALFQSMLHRAFNGEL